MSSQLKFWLAAICMPNSNPRKFLRWVSHFSGIEAVFAASVADLQQINCNEFEIQAIKNPNWQQVAKQLQWINHHSQYIICFDDVDYPEQLKEISDPPLVLFVKGNKQALHQHQLAMVGARAASTQGIKNAEFFAAALAQQGFTITSGLALGIDAASHRGTLKVNGVTIAVCGTGLNYTYPASHKNLVEKILAQNGAIVSEFLLEEKPFPSHFPRRNRIIAGLSLGVLVVEAALKSGSLITARLALEYGREVFAIPGNIQHPLSHGPHSLIRQGAKLVEQVTDIIDEFTHLSLSSISRAVAISPLAQVSLECEQLLNYIEYETTPMDMIVLRSGMASSQLSSLLLSLELDGYIEPVTGGFIKLHKS